MVKAKTILNQRALKNIKIQFAHNVPFTLFCTTLHLINNIEPMIFSMRVQEICIIILLLLCETVINDQSEHYQYSIILIGIILL